MSNIPKKNSEYYLPYRYNKYLIDKSNEVLSLDLRKNNLSNMIEFGRHNGEIMRNVEEYIQCLNYEAYHMMNINKTLKVLTYHEFVRDYKINYIIT